MDFVHTGKHLIKGIAWTGKGYIKTLVEVWKIGVGILHLTQERGWIISSQVMILV
jgi:hypothetical protein